jgi:high-affinity iron transporter
MMGAALIVFREVFEAGLIVGIVLGATRGIAGRDRWIIGAILSGVCAACVVAGFAATIADAMEGAGQEVFNALILLSAAIMLGWHTVWMARHGRELAAEMKLLGAAVVSGARSHLAMAVVIATAILREGAEVVLFIYGMAVGGDDVASLATGAMLELAGGISVSILLYQGLTRIPMRSLFAATNPLLSLLAAGMAAGAAGFLVQAEWLPALGLAWDSSAILDQKTILGRALHALLGYADRPNWMQVGVYAITVLGLWMASRRISTVHHMHGSVRPA